MVTLEHKPTDYMERCPYCKKYLLETQVANHKCEVPLRTVQEIPVVFSYETTSQKGLSVVIALGFDGILYRLVTCKNPLADDWKQGDGTDDKVPVPVQAI